ncbi:hypothetical protein [Desulfobacter sp.]
MKRIVDYMPEYVGTNFHRGEAIQLFPEFHQKRYRRHPISDQDKVQGRHQEEGKYQNLFVLY